jgi:hypothetical protein
MEVRALSADLEAIALQELNEDRDRIEEDLKHIRNWLSKQPHLTARTGNNHSAVNSFFFLVLQSTHPQVIKNPKYWVTQSAEAVLYRRK